jgi:hypothetical protein
MRSAPYDLSPASARVDALFASALQRSDEPSAAQVRQAVVVVTGTLGPTGCAARVAQEYGEHPETAAVRMRWARTAVAGAFSGSSGSCPSPAVRASRARSPRNRSAAAYV